MRFIIRFYAEELQELGKRLKALGYAPVKRATHGFDVIHVYFPYRVF